VKRIFKMALPAALLIALFNPAPIWACAACYGQSDSPMARGMNWGIFTLLGIVACVLATFAAFFVHIGRKSAADPASAELHPPADPQNPPPPHG
jgi:hypothetical protein